MTVQPVAAGDVTIDVTDHVALVTINRPEKRNALTQAMYATLADALEQADGDLGTRAMVITGTGNSFTAGNDLADFVGGGNLDQVQRFLITVASAQVPLVAAVNGLAIGVGLTMLLHCDLVYVEPDARLFAPFVELGLVPEAGSSLLLPRVVGERRASELILGGRHIDGIEAVNWGLANALATPVVDRALEAARQIAAQPPRAMRTSKALLRSNETTLPGRMAEEMSAFVAALGGKEFPEVIAARSEKRAPVFTD
jgi:enoyl-CoA hydratase/carnithine racemase